MKKKWTIRNGNVLVFGVKPEKLPQTALISLTRGEGLNIIQLFFNQILTLLIMNQMKKYPGLLYAELVGEIKRGRGSGQTLTVWDGNSMRQFRKESTHGIAKNYLSWIIHRKNTKNYYLTYSAKGVIPSTTEAIEIMRKHAKFYDSGKLVRKASQPKIKHAK